MNGNGGNYFRAMLLRSLDSFERMWKITVYCQTLFLILSQLTTHSQFCWKQELKTTWLVKEFVMELLPTKLTPTVWISPFDDLYHRHHHHCDHHPSSGWMRCVSFYWQKRVTLKGKVGPKDKPKPYRDWRCSLNAFPF